MWFGNVTARAAEILSLAIKLLRESLVPCAAVQVLMGQGHALRTRRALWSYARRLSRFADPTRGGAGPELWPSEARRELLGLMALLPSAGTDLRSPIDECVTAPAAWEADLRGSQSAGWPGGRPVRCGFICIGVGVAIIAWWPSATSMAESSPRAHMSGSFA